MDYEPEMPKSNLLIFHVGDPKTGSTSIQGYMSMFRARDPETGLWFPPSDTPNPNHNSLRQCFRDPASVAPTYERHFGMLEEAPDNTVAVFSSEPMAQLPPGEILAAIPDWFMTSERWDFRVLSYIRPHVSSILSGYQQSVKSGGTTLSLGEWIAKMPERAPRQYAKRVSAWRDGIGARYIVRPFVRDELVDGDVVADFVNVIAGITGQAPYGDLPVTEANTGIDAPGIAVSIHLSRRIREIPLRKERRIIIQRFRAKVGRHIKIPEGRLEVGAEDLLYLQENFRADAQALDSMLFDRPLFEELLMNAKPADRTTSVELEDHFPPEDAAWIRDAIEEEAAALRGEG